MENIIRKGISEKFYFYFFSWSFYYFSAGYFWYNKILISISDELNKYRYIFKNAPLCT